MGNICLTWQYDGFIYIFELFPNWYIVGPKTVGDYVKLQFLKTVSIQNCMLDLKQNSNLCDFLKDWK